MKLWAHLMGILISLFLFGEVLAPPSLAQDSTTGPPQSADQKPVEEAKKGQEASVDKILQPFLWRIEGKVPSYLFGTIHLPDPRVVNLPDVVLKAIDGADAVYTELAMDQADLGLSMQAKMVRTDGKSLEDVLGKDLYARLGKVLKSKGLAAKMFDRFNVWAVDVMLQTMDMMPLLANGEPLDGVIYNRAKKAGKEVGGIETVDEQLAALTSGTEKDQIRVLERTVEALEKAELDGVTELEKLTQLYLRGDAQELFERMYEDVSEDDKSVHDHLEELLYVRNRNMAERADAKMKEAPERSFFFAFGAAHFPDKEGVVDLLRKRGYVVVRLGIDGGLMKEPLPVDRRKPVKVPR